MTKIIDNLNNKQKKELHAFYQKEWWSNDRTLEDIEFILKHSSFYIGLVDDNDKLLAFARILTDYFQFAYVYDVIVAEENRERGLGKKLMEAIIIHPALRNIKNIELVCRREKQSFYEQFGFSTNYGKSVAMRKQKL